jgi:hypothetical protein
VIYGNSLGTSLKVLVADAFNHFGGHFNYDPLDFQPNNLHLSNPKGYSKLGDLVGITMAGHILNEP